MRDLRSGAEAEPDDQDGRERDFRNGLERHEQGVEEALKEAGGDDQHAQRNAGQDGEKEPEDDLLQRHQRMKDELSRVPGNAVEDLRRGRKDEGGHGRQGADDLPRDQQEAVDQEDGSVASQPVAGPAG